MIFLVFFTSTSGSSDVVAISVVVSIVVRFVEVIARAVGMAERMQCDFQDSNIKYLSRPVSN